MIQFVIIIGLIYGAAMITLSLRARKTAKEGSQGYFFAGAGLGTVLGMFTFAATLFSAFTILGMPDFFRTHGVGAWIFLAVADAGMVFGIIWLGRKMKKIGTEGKKFSITGLISEKYGSPWAGYITFFGAFVFLLPYVAVQIRGVSIFLQGAFPDVLPFWAWALGMVVIVLLYSETGGLKAIIYNDTLQGVLLLIAIWVIGANCLSMLGGWSSMFEKVAQTNEALLSNPGPKGMFSFQFMLASILAIMMIPYTQPQVSTRILIMKDERSLNRMAVGVGIFAILVILPTLFVGLYGAVTYPDSTTDIFLSRALIGDQPGFIAAFVLIGLIAAAISTADSQIFALGSELMSLLRGHDKRLMIITKVFLIVFAGLAFLLSIFSSNELVLLARTSFAGTALMAPMIFLGLFSSHRPSLIMPFVTLAGLLVFILSSFPAISAVPGSLGGIRMDLLLLGLLSLTATGLYLAKK
ncbi:MAG: sodium:solute symporter family protein [Bacteroidia bacterium]